MKFLFLLLFLFSGSVTAQTCYAPKMARDAVRAIALVTDRSMITDIVGAAVFDTYQIWANYRSHGYSDHYRVKVSEKECRVLELKLVTASGPIKNPN
jgi:hypothetical protein